MATAADDDLPLVFGGIGYPVLSAVFGLILCFAATALAGAMDLAPASLFVVTSAVAFWLYAVLGIVRPQRLILGEEELILERTIGPTLQLRRDAVERFHEWGFDYRSGWVSYSPTEPPVSDRISLGFWSYPVSLKAVLEIWRTAGLTEAAAVRDPYIVIRRRQPAARLLP